MALVVAADVGSAHPSARAAALAPSAPTGHDCEGGALLTASGRHPAAPSVAADPTACPPPPGGDQSQGDEDECKSPKHPGDGAGRPNPGEPAGTVQDKCNPAEHEPPEPARDGDADDAAPAPVVVAPPVITVVGSAPAPPPLLGAVPAPPVVLLPAPVASAPASTPPPAALLVPPLVLTPPPQTQISAGVARASVASVAGSAVGVTVACMVAGLLGSVLVLRRR